jgi:hypothetical protein
LPMIVFFPAHHFMIILCEPTLKRLGLSHFTVERYRIGSYSDWGLSWAIRNSYLSLALPWGRRQSHSYLSIVASENMELRMVLQNQLSSLCQYSVSQGLVYKIPKRMEQVASSNLQAVQDIKTEKATKIE